MDFSLFFRPPSIVFTVLGEPKLKNNNLTPRELINT